jgi:hypothetical protein
LFPIDHEKFRIGKPSLSLCTTAATCADTYFKSQRQTIDHVICRPWKTVQFSSLGNCRLSSALTLLAALGRIRPRQSDVPLDLFTHSFFVSRHFHVLNVQPPLVFSVTQPLIQIPIYGSHLYSDNAIEPQVHATITRRIHF